MMNMMKGFVNNKPVQKLFLLFFSLWKSLITNCRIILIGHDINFFIKFQQPSVHKGDRDYKEQVNNNYSFTFEYNHVYMNNKLYVLLKQYANVYLINDIRKTCYR